MIPETSNINGREIKASGMLSMVSVMARSSLLVPCAEKLFNVGEDGTFEECYEKAVAWAAAN